VVSAHDDQVDASSGAFNKLVSAPVTVNRPKERKPNVWAEAGGGFRRNRWRDV
jgi:hypothetical protein